MIIFYDRKTGEIVGSVNGRMHGEDHLKMWVGDKTERLIVQWKPFKYYDKNKNIIPNECVDALYENGDPIVVAADFEPDSDQKEIYIELDKKPFDIYKYSVDIKTLKLVKRG